MNTKSAIQVTAELLEAKAKFFESIVDLVDRYTIADNVFACDPHGLPVELTEGYYGETGSFDTLEEAAKDFNICMHGLRIHDGKYSVGVLYKDLASVKEELIIDLADAKIL